ncbi:MAG TPA: DUF2892 domain-containing protein [Gemmatimonadales bacterium]|jgi:hypothetical protein|nr:DUF2892 domain-containing protein [Gemmatimonadales bacterium]
MFRNLGVTERVVRIAVGLGLLGLYGTLDAPWKYVVLIGLLPLGTGLVGHCPVYRAAGWKTTRH